MSTYDATTSFVVESDLAREVPRTSIELGRLMDVALSRTADGPLRFVDATSRGGWLQHATRMLLAGLSFPSLSFLVGEDGSWIEDEVVLRNVFALQPAQQPRAVEEGRQLLALLANKPQLLLSYEFLDEAQVLQALHGDFFRARPKVSVNEVTGSEGNMGEDLVVYLRSALQVLQTANDERSAFLHVVDWEGRDPQPFDAPARASVEIPAKLLSRLGLPPGERHLLDIRLADGRRFFRVPVANGIVLQATELSGEVHPVAFTGDEIAEVRPAGSLLKSLLGLW